MFPRYENRTDASSHPFIDGGTAERPAHAQDAQVTSFGDVGVSRNTIPATIPDSATQIRTDTVAQHNRFRERNHVNYQNKPRCRWMALVRERSGRCIGPSCLDRRVRSVARHAGAAAGQLGWSVDRSVNARDFAIGRFRVWNPSTAHARRAGEYANPASRHMLRVAV